MRLEENSGVWGARGMVKGTGDGIRGCFSKGGGGYMVEYFREETRHLTWKEHTIFFLPGVLLITVISTNLVWPVSLYPSHAAHEEERVALFGRLHPCKNE